MDGMQLPEFKPQGTAEAPAAAPAQSENNADNTDALANEVDSIFKQHEDVTEVEATDNGDGTVTLPKEKLTKLAETKDKYRDGLLGIKKTHLDKKPTQQPAQQVQIEQPKEGDYLSRADFYKANETQAIQNIATKDPAVTEKWSEIMEHFSGKRGRSTVQNIEEDIRDAVAVWKARTGYQEPEDKSNPAPLGHEQTRPAGSPTGGKPSDAQPGGVIPRRTSPKEWYPKSK